MLPGRAPASLPFPVRPRTDLVGAVAQLGERLNGIQEVDGSIPFGSTNKNRLARLSLASLGIRVSGFFPVPSGPRERC